MAIIVYPQLNSCNVRPVRLVEHMRVLQFSTTRAKARMCSILSEFEIRLQFSVTRGPREAAAASSRTASSSLSLSSSSSSSFLSMKCSNKRSTLALPNDTQDHTGTHAD